MTMYLLVRSAELLPVGVEVAGIDKWAAPVESTSQMSWKSFQSSFAPSHRGSVHRQ